MTRPVPSAPLDDDTRARMVGEAWAHVFVAFAVGAIDIATCRAIERALFSPPPYPDWARHTGETQH